FSMAFAFSKISEGTEAERPPAGKLLSLQNGNTLKELQSTFHHLVGLVEKDQALGRRLSRGKVLAQTLAEGAPAIEKKIPKVKKTSRKRVQQQAPAGETDTLEPVSHYLELGRLNEAATLCEDYLKKNPESSDAYYYLGLISQRKGSPGGAESLLKKALYLDPAHHLALAQLAELAEKRGDSAQAKDYRRRQKRAMRRKTGSNE
ncbi:MAG TPA: tetratricopeptide repeat protein, partial [Gammaproteobacteria bacterium]|nr:tetratricopeptide repeat protein [Gammaproteobacteria bacterium]